MLASTPAARFRPGERLKQTIWLMALCRGGTPPMPTVERVNALKLLAAAWAKEDAVNEET
jgi:hypothetical protein